MKSLLNAATEDGAGVPINVLASILVLASGEFDGASVELRMAPKGSDNYALIHTFESEGSAVIDPPAIPNCPTFSLRAAVVGAGPNTRVNVEVAE
jgi:hypothetical protein